MADEFPGPKESDLLPRIPVPPTEREVMERFEEFASKPGNKNRVRSRFDASKLLTVKESGIVFGNYNFRSSQVFREYYTYNLQTNKFDSLARAVFNKRTPSDAEDDEEGEFYLSAIFKNGERPKSIYPELAVHFPDMNKPGGFRIGFHVGGARIVLNYVDDGALDSVDDGTDGYGVNDNGEPWETKLEFIKNSVVVNPALQGFTYSYSPEAQALLITTDGGAIYQAKDRLDLEAIRDLLAPRKLLRDPYSARSDQDSSWKNIDLLKLFGISEVLSLQRERGEDYPTS